MPTSQTSACQFSAALVGRRLLVIVPLFCLLPDSPCPNPLSRRGRTRLEDVESVLAREGKFQQQNMYIRESTAVCFPSTKKANTKQVSKSSRAGLPIPCKKQSRLASLDLSCTARLQEQGCPVATRKGTSNLRSLEAEAFSLYFLRFFVVAKRKERESKIRR